MKGVESADEEGNMNITISKQKKHQKHHRTSLLERAKVLALVLNFFLAARLAAALYVWNFGQKRAITAGGTRSQLPSRKKLMIDCSRTASMQPLRPGSALQYYSSVKLEIWGL